MTTLRPRAWISSLRPRILRARCFHYPSICSSWISRVRPDTCAALEGVSDLMKIQVRVGPSRIAGQGLFAAQDIHKGTRIIQYIGARIPKAESAQRLSEGNANIFACNERYDIDGKTRKNTARYINHSCEPNCEAVVTKHTIWIVALWD